MKYNMDSPFIRFLTRVADIMILNIAFIITSLPVFTIGASWTALYYVAGKMVRNEEGLILADFFKSFRQNFKQATILWLIIAAVIAVLLLDLYIIKSMMASTFAECLRTVIIVLAVLIWMLLQYVFPSLSRFEASNGATLKNAAIFAVSDLPRTVFMSLFSGGLIAFTFLNKYTIYSGIFAWLTVGFAIIALANSNVLSKVYARCLCEKSTANNKQDTVEERQ